MNKVSGKGGYRTPEGYFTRLPDRVMDRIKAESGSKKNPDGGFKVPDGYFDRFPDRLEERMAHSPSKVRKLWPSRLGWVAAAAAAILLLFLIPDRQAAEIEFGDLTGETIAEYLGSKEEDLSSDEIAEALPLDEIALEDMLDASLETQHIAEYLENDREVDEEFYWNNDE
jgi:hypothetical protein